MSATHAPFRPTRWTLIAEANGPDKAAARAALEKLCAAYWYPLYAYVRRRGRGPDPLSPRFRSRQRRHPQKQFLADRLAIELGGAGFWGEATKNSR